ncbi:MAG: hypothetical protein V7750_00220 [Sneathiella sp.]
MIPSSLGASAGSIPPASLVAKPQDEEQFVQTPQEQALEAPAERASTPPVPGASGAAISIEAVTALQQADQSAEADNQASKQSGVNFVTTELEKREVSFNVAEQVNAATETEQEAIVETREIDQTEVPVGEETDSAGRSTRNPIDLQI